MLYVELGAAEEQSVMAHKIRMPALWRSTIYSQYDTGGAFQQLCIKFVRGNAIDHAQPALEWLARFHAAFWEATPSSDPSAPPTKKIEPKLSSLWPQGWCQR